MDKEYKPLKCGFCLDEITGRKRKFCDATCRSKSKNKTGLTLEQWNQIQKDRRVSKEWFDCEVCGLNKKRRRSSSNLKKGYKNRFCSHNCLSKHYAKISAEVQALRRIAKWKPKKAKIEKVHKVFTCLSCGATRNGGSYGWHKYCSIKCRPKPVVNKQSDSFKKARKAWRLKRKAIERGAAKADRFHPFVVFNRYGWICQICGIKTPEKLRGSYKDNAPELDHIIPLSKGGHHSLSNSQTSCRKCNISKSNKRVSGQIGLFTGIL